MGTSCVFVIGSWGGIPFDLTCHVRLWEQGVGNPVRQGPQSNRVYVLDNVDNSFPLESDDVS